MMILSFSSGICSYRKQRFGHKHYMYPGPAYREAFSKFQVDTKRLKKKLSVKQLKTKFQKYVEACTSED